MNRHIPKGFTLFELMVVLGILGILTSIAYGSYQNSMNTTRRTDAHASLLDLASLMEKQFLNSTPPTYANATIGTGNATDVLTTATSSEGFYTLAITNATATTYTVRATALDTQAAQDTNCSQLFLNHLGQKTSLDSGGNPSTDCW